MSVCCFDVREQHSYTSTTQGTVVFSRLDNYTKSAIASDVINKRLKLLTANWFAQRLTIVGEILSQVEEC